MTNDFDFDLQEIYNIVDTADVFIVRFMTFEKRMLVDARFDDVDGPMLKVVARAGSVEERFRSLKRMRPRFQLPERILSFFWPRYVQSLETSGIWQRITERLMKSGHAGVQEQCQETFRELLQAERDEAIAAIRGQGYQSLWESKAS